MLGDLGPPDDRQMQAIWIAGTFLAWGMVLTGVLVYLAGGPDAVGIALVVAGFLVRMVMFLSIDWLMVEPDDQ